MPRVFSNYRCAVGHYPTCWYLDGAIDRANLGAPTMPRISISPAIAVLSLLLLASTATAQIPFEPLIAVSNARVFSPKTALVNTPAELSAAWIDLGLEGPPPTVDF